MNAHLEISAPLTRLIAFSACAALAVMAPVAAERMALTAPVKAQNIDPTGLGSIRGSSGTDLPASFDSRSIAGAFDIQTAHGVQMAGVTLAQPARLAASALHAAMR